MSREEIREILRQHGRRLSELEFQLAQPRAVFVPRESSPEPDGAIYLLLIGIGILAFIAIRFFMCFWQAILLTLGFSGLFALLGLTAGWMINERVGKILACIAGASSLFLLSYILSQGVVGNFLFEDAFIADFAWQSFSTTSLLILLALVAINVVIAFVKWRNRQ